ncbi:DNA-binding XRE family transcriptional regulator [Actinoplanes lutulentus]|uniref:DNA-binding XRE family transcriptional regulator n=1 Tax=Actinoplanes lutulentus TaxID=1287878 RepID=A0A327Z2U6_9ACTN|nr:helix-turn-helix transcriptional regulator [Actinoplanes lutulentus]MBB2943273.1 DNA-binding XRE family transcriptional regulator [Actinoplanes lutulentus]RAK28333.1 DNA-binding XRE family transcriptional regulator [Actinoplanes lutulentus]
MATKRLRLVKFRKTAGHTQETLAQELGVERSTVVRWEAGGTEPQPWMRPRLARALRISDDELRSALDDVVQTQDSASERIEDRPASLDLVSVALLHEEVRNLNDRYDESPSTTLLGPAGQLHGRVVNLRKQAPTARVRRALFEVEAESAIFMGQLVWDVSQRRNHLEPVTYLDQAIHAARQAREPCNESYALLRKSFVALYGEKDPDKGRALATEAADVARSCSPSLTGLAMLHVAEGHAMSGNRTLCETALSEAGSQIGEVNDVDVAAGSYSINEYNRLAGSCYLFLGLPEEAQPILETASKSLAGRKSQAIALGNLTLALLRQTKLDEAADTMHRTIDAVELTRGGGGLNLAFAAGRELRPWRDEPWAQDLYDRLLALMAPN